MGDGSTIDGIPGMPGRAATYLHGVLYHGSTN